jgi:hypothetical protein
MKLLQQPVYAKRKQVIKVHIDKPAVVKFFTPDEYAKYKKGVTHNYWGGFSENSPARFEVPRKGVYHAVIELGSMSNPIQVQGKVELRDPEFQYMNGVPQNETHENIEVEYDDTLE